MTQLVPYKERAAMIKKALVDRMDQIQASLPDEDIKADRLVRIALTTIIRNPNLVDCDPTSIVASVLDCAQLGLVPDGHLGEAWFLPYKKKCQMIPGYQGIVKLARQSGEIKKLDAHMVHDGDEFSVEYGDNPVLIHSPDFACEEKPVTHVYAVAWLTNGEKLFRVMSFNAVEAIRMKSPAGRSGPWVTHWEAMAIKTVLKQLCKLLPRSTRLQRAISLDDRADVGLDQENEDLVEPVELVEPKKEVDPGKIKAIMASYRELGLGDETRHEHMMRVVKKDSVKDLTDADASVLLDCLKFAKEEKAEQMPPDGGLSEALLDPEATGCCTCGETTNTRAKGAYYCQWCKEQRGSKPKKLIHVTPEPERPRVSAVDADGRVEAEVDAFAKELPPPGPPRHPVDDDLGIGLEVDE